MINQREEMEANAFALALMMPEKLVIEAIHKYCPEGINFMDDTDINKLAEIFKVAPSMMAFRLGQLFEQRIIKVR